MSDIQVTLTQPAQVQVSFPSPAYQSLDALDATGVLVRATGSTISRTFGDIEADVVNVKFFNAKGDGITDDTAAIQAAATAAAGKKLYFPASATPYLVGTAITLLDNTEVMGDGKGSVIKITSGDINGFVATGRSYITIHNLQVFSVTIGTTAGVAGVCLNNCDKCRVYNCVFIGMSWSGVFLNVTTNSEVVSNSFSGILGTNGDSNDVCCYRAANGNLISLNNCYGGGYHGVLVQNPDAATPGVCLNNTVTHNQVSGQSCYGIACYSSTSGYYNGHVVANNNIRHILGTQISGASGAGIYIVQAGGTVVSGNNISDCCVSTTNFGTLAPACIGVATASGSWPVNISNNVLTSTRGPCIAAITNEGMLNINGNSCTLSNSTGGTNSTSIYLCNCSNARVNGNTVNHASTVFYAVTFFSIDPYVSTGNSFTNNTINSDNYGFISAISGTTGTHVDLNFAGNIIKGCSQITVQITNGSGLLVLGNNLGSTGIVYTQTSVTNSRISGNKFMSSSGSASILFGAGNTGGIASECNVYSGTISNDPASGVIISQYLNSAGGGSNTFRAGDRVIQSVPVVGNPKGWRCTVSGAPGTWVSEGNL